MFQRIKNIYHFIRAIMVQIMVGFPSRKMKVIGITGTDGKTTTTHLIYHILTHAKKKASMISTVYAKIAGNEFDTGFHVTTPDAWEVARYLKMAADKKQEYFILETTSHRLEQNQLAGVRFHMGIITNITHEHLDYHKSINEYAKSKFRLLNQSAVALINADDPNTQKEIRKTSLKAKTFGLKNHADYKKDFKKTISGLTQFNAYNYLTAYAACRELGISEKDILDALQSFRLPPGRLDIVFSGDIKVIVDFAHTPFAIESVLSSVRENYLKKQGRLIHVFGSAGLRDTSKREAMGKASATYADIIILTEEDYRTEDPRAICEAVGKGIQKKGKEYTTYTDRYEAIQKALLSARQNDVVIITGKGHESSLCRGKKEYPWSDKQCVLDIMSSIQNDSV